MILWLTNNTAELAARVGAQLRRNNEYLSPKEYSPQCPYGTGGGIYESPIKWLCRKDGMK